MYEVNKEIFTKEEVEEFIFQQAKRQFDLAKVVEKHSATNVGKLINEFTLELWKDVMVNPKKHAELFMLKKKEEREKMKERERVQERYQEDKRRLSND